MFEQYKTNSTHYRNTGFYSVAYAVALITLRKALNSVGTFCEPSINREGRPVSKLINWVTANIMKMTLNAELRVTNNRKHLRVSVNNVEYTFFINDNEYIAIRSMIMNSDSSFAGMDTHSYIPWLRSDVITRERIRNYDRILGV